MTFAPGSSGTGEYPVPDWVVPDWVRVRREDFGLLFYDTRSTRLTYVRSGEMLIPPPFTGGSRALRVAETVAEGDAALERLLRNLQEKGLLVAAAAE